jgi:hypothetical protein
MSSTFQVWQRKISLHGAAIQISCAVQRLIPQCERVLRPFVAPDLPATSAMSIGIIRPFDELDVLRHVSSRARRLPASDPWLELYQDGERFWMVDERWGIGEINLLKGQWRSWVLPGSTMDPFHLAEASLLWPLAQILRPRRVHLVPAASVVRGGWGILLLSPFSLEPELGRLIKCGYRVIGQRWTALREREGTVEMLHLPGLVEKGKSVTSRRRGTGSAVQWLDLNREYAGCSEKSALCHAVLMAEPGRRSAPKFVDLAIPEAQEQLKRLWPIVDIHPSAGAGKLANRLAQMCRCASVQLSHDAADLALMLESARTSEPQGSPRVTILTSDMQRTQRAA